jgi:hypothetical protein
MCGKFPGDFVIGRVLYIDFEQPKATPKTLSPVFMKRRSFEHEHELRLVYWEPPQRDGKWDASAAKGSYNFPVDLAVMIETIFISPH